MKVAQRSTALSLAIGLAFSHACVAAAHPKVVAELAARLKQHRRLQPAGGVPVYHRGRANFKPPKNWRVEPK